MTQELKMQEAVLEIKSANLNEPEPNYIEFSTDALYACDGEYAAITYYETEVTGLEGTRTGIVVSKDKVIVDRQGMITSRMEFEPDNKNSFQYATPYGAINFTISTREIQKSFDENGGTMSIKYVVDVEHSAISQNLFSLRVRPIRRQNERTGQ